MWHSSVKISANWEAMIRFLKRPPEEPLRGNLPTGCSEKRAQFGFVVVWTRLMQPRLFLPLPLAGGAPAFLDHTAWLKVWGVQLEDLPSSFFIHILTNINLILISVGYVATSVRAEDSVSSVWRSWVRTFEFYMPAGQTLIQAAVHPLWVWHSPKWPMRSLGADRDTLCSPECIFSVLSHTF